MLNAYTKRGAGVARGKVGMRGEIRQIKDPQVGAEKRAGGRQTSLPGCDRLGGRDETAHKGKKKKKQGEKKKTKKPAEPWKGLI